MILCVWCVAHVYLPEIEVLPWPSENFLANSTSIDILCYNFSRVSSISLNVFSKFLSSKDFLIYM